MADKNSTALQAFGVRTMSTREIAELTGKRHDHVMADAKAMLEELGGGVPEIQDTPYTHQQNGQTYREYLLPKRESLILVSGYSVAMRARIIDRWEALETGKAQPMAVQSGGAVEAMAVADALCKMLRLEGSARLGVASKAMELTAPHLLPMVPVYAIDAPTGSTAASSEATAALTTLLKRHGHKVSTAACNIALRDLGIIEAKSRPSSKGGAVFFWSLTDVGLKYGENVSSPKNQRETQPHWYEAKFPDLARLLRL